MPLTTLAAAKSRMRLPAAADPEQDPVIQAFLDAVEETILDLTGFAFDDGGTNVKVEDHADVQLGVVETMRFRPVVPLVGSGPESAVKLEARALASGTFSTILGEIKDSFRGRVVALSSDGVVDYRGDGGSPEWFKWRQPRWPVVRFTYRVDFLGSPTNPTPQALVTAATEWAVALYSRPGGGSLKSVSVERVSETYADGSEPSVVQMLLAKYLRDAVALAH